MPRMSFLVEVEVPQGQRLCGIAVQGFRNPEMICPEELLRTIWSRPQRIREGKRLKVTRGYTEVLAVGEALPGEERPTRPPFTMLDQPCGVCGELALRLFHPPGARSYIDCAHCANEQ